MLEGFGILLKEKQYLIGYISKMLMLPFFRKLIALRILLKVGDFSGPGKCTSFSHGTNHSRGILILINDKLQFEMKNTQSDSDGRYVLIDALIQDSPFLLLNIYAPNITSEQCSFFSRILSTLDETDGTFSSQLIIGGDFNAHLHEELDNYGGRVEKKDSVKNIMEIKLAYDLVDIWRIRNPNKRKFTWRQKKPLIQRRLDYWLISDGLQDFIEDSDIIPSIKSDHSAITLQINSFEDKVRGPSHWIFNSSLLNDYNYLNLIASSYQDWLTEFQEVSDKRLLWDLIKYKIRQCTISFCKTKARDRRNKLTDLEKKLKESEELCACNPTEQNILQLEELKSTFCQISEESLEHLFIHCPISSAFWLSVVEWLKNYFSTIQCLTDVSIMFGLFGKETQLINHIIVIFQCRLLKVDPSLSLLKTKIKIACQVERVIGEQNDIVDSHNEKWKAILHHIQDL